MGGTNNRLAGARRQIADDRGFNLDFSLHDFPLGSDKPWSVPYLLRGSKHVLDRMVSIREVRNHAGKYRAWDVARSIALGIIEADAPAVLIA